MSKAEVAAAIQNAPAYRPKAYNENDPLDYRLFAADAAFLIYGEKTWQET